jgi:tRNA 2-selenouridine synthase
MTNAELTRLFVNDAPLIDVRAPVEFSRGAFPGAVNLPILDDVEREAVGICYKESGADAAEILGHELVSGEKREKRIEHWVRFLRSNPDALLYCYRGGQRSQIACQWLKDTGYPVPRIEGGYKRLRNHLLSVFENLPSLVIVSGSTGTGKTDFLKCYTHSIDLEEIANHRGSAFGSRITPQPSQIDFENELAIAFLKLAEPEHPQTEVLLEDESRLIGRIHVPVLLQDAMKMAPIIVLEESVELRTERIFGEYIEHQWTEYEAHHGEDASTEFEKYLLTAVDAIRKRLGNVAHDEIRSMVTRAISLHRLEGSLDDHRIWITTLLSDYYDPMYRYQLENKSSRVVMQGPRDEVMDWYAEYQGSISNLEKHG